MNDVNWLGIPVALIAVTLLGGVWFAVLFPRAYNVSLGHAPDATRKPTPLLLAGPPVAGLVITLTSAVLLAALKIDTYGPALLFGLLTGVGYLSANTLTIAINPNFPHPLRYATISAGYNILSAVLISLILITV